MDKSQIIKITNDALMEEFELELSNLTPDAHIVNDLGLDSLDIVDMVVVLEKAFDTKIENKKDLATILTLGDIYDFLEKVQHERMSKQ